MNYNWHKENEFIHLKPKDDILYICIKRNQPISRKDLQELLVNPKNKKPLMSYTTFQKHLVNMREERKIIYDKQTKQYSINPLFKEFTKNTEEQLRYEFEVQKNKLDNLPTINLMENELYLRIHNNTSIFYNFGEDLNGKIYFSKEISSLLGRLVHSLIREVVTMNPELWYVMNKPEHFNFSFGIDCKLSEDPEIFKLISMLRQKYIEEFKEIPLYIKSSYSRNIRIEDKDLENIKLTESKKEKLKFKFNIPKGVNREEYLKKIYTNAVGEYFLLRKEYDKEKEKGIEKLIEDDWKANILNDYDNIKQMIKELGEKEEYNPFYKEYREKIEKELKKLKDQKE